MNKERGLFGGLFGGKKNAAPDSHHEQFSRMTEFTEKVRDVVSAEIQSRQGDHVYSEIVYMDLFEQTSGDASKVTPEMVSAALDKAEGESNGIQSLGQ